MPGLIDFTGFELGRWPNRWHIGLGTPFVTGTNPLDGQYSLNSGYYANSQWATYVIYNLEKALSEIYMKFKFKPSSIYTATQPEDRWFGWFNNATELGVITLTQKDDRRWRAYSGAKSTLLWTGTTQFVAGTVYEIGLHIKIADSGGIVEMLIDGNLEGTFTGDTKPGADTQFNILRVGGVGCNPPLWDNFVFRDDAYPCGLTNSLG